MGAIKYRLSSLGRRDHREMDKPVHRMTFGRFSWTRRFASAAVIGAPLSSRTLPEAMRPWARAAARKANSAPLSTVL